MFLLSRPLVLASQSPRRAQILAMLGFAFTVQPSGCDETVSPDMDPAAVPGALARAKALEVARIHSETLVLGADTVVVIDGMTLGKPADAAAARHMLRRLRGRTHRVYTGVAVARGDSVVAAETVCTEVDFAEVADADLEAYARGGEPLDKAGAYAVQGRGAFLVQEIRGCYFNVMGLPVQATLRLLAPFRAV